MALCFYQLGVLQVLADLNCSSATDLIRYTATDLQPVASELQSSKLASEVGLVFPLSSSQQICRKRLQMLS